MSACGSAESPSETTAPRTTEPATGTTREAAAPEVTGTAQSSNPVPTADRQTQETKTEEPEEEKPTRIPTNTPVPTATTPLMPTFTPLPEAPYPSNFRHSREQALRKSKFGKAVSQGIFCIIDHQPSAFKDLILTWSEALARRYDIPQAQAMRTVWIEVRDASKKTRMTSGDLKLIRAYILAEGANQGTLSYVLDACDNGIEYPEQFPPLAAKEYQYWKNGRPLEELRYFRLTEGRIDSGYQNPKIRESLNSEEFAEFFQNLSLEEKAYWLSFHIRTDGLLEYMVSDNNWETEDDPFWDLIEKATEPEEPLATYIHSAKVKITECFADPSVRERYFRDNAERAYAIHKKDRPRDYNTPVEERIERAKERLVTSTRWPIGEPYRYPFSYRESFLNDQIEIAWYMKEYCGEEYHPLGWDYPHHIPDQD